MLCCSFVVCLCIGADLIHCISCSSAYSRTVYNIRPLLQGGFILHSYLTTEERLPSTYYAAVICDVVFSLLEALLIIAVINYMKGFAARAVKHIVNRRGQELDNKGEVIREKTSLSRLMKLAKPVSGINTSYSKQTLLY